MPAERKKEKRRLKGLEYGTFTGRFPNDIMAVKGLTFFSFFNSAIKN